MGTPARIFDRADHPGAVIRHAAAAGSLYPALQRLAKKGWATSTCGQTAANQRATFYRLTSEGNKQFLREESRWAELVTAISQVMNPATARGTKE